MWEQSIRDKAYERRLFRARAIVAAVLVITTLFVLAWRMTYLQVTLHEKYQDLSLLSHGPCKDLKMLDNKKYSFLGEQPGF